MMGGIRIGDVACHVHGDRVHLVDAGRDEMVALDAADLAKLAEWVDGAVTPYRPEPLGECHETKVRRLTLSTGAEVKVGMQMEHPREDCSDDA